MSVVCLRGHRMWQGWAPLSVEESGPGARPTTTAMWCACTLAGTSSAHPGGDTDRALALAGSDRTGAGSSASGLESQLATDCVMQSAGPRSTGGAA